MPYLSSILIGAFSKGMVCGCVGGCVGGVFRGRKGEVRETDFDSDAEGTWQQTARTVFLICSEDS